jgi:hypothetical protein
MKNAFQDMQSSAMSAKSQLIAESLARSISRLITDLEAPKVLYSVLFDACCLHVLVHFPCEKKAFLSHREIEPGRITCVIAWLHTLSARDDLTVDQFLELGFMVGNTIQTEVKASQTKRGRLGNQKVKGSSRHGTSVPKQASGGQKRGLNTDMCLDTKDDEQRDLELEQHRKLATFSHFQNHYRFGDELPMTEGVLNVFQKDTHPGHTMSAAELMRRAGFTSIER